MRYWFIILSTVFSVNVYSVCSFEITYNVCNLEIFCDGDLTYSFNLPTTTWKETANGVYVKDDASSLNMPLSSITNFTTVDDIFDSLTLWKSNCIDIVRIDSFYISNDSLYLLTSIDDYFVTLIDQDSTNEIPSSGFLLGDSVCFVYPTGDTACADIGSFQPDLTGIRDSLNALYDSIATIQLLVVDLNDSIDAHRTDINNINAQLQTHLTNDLDTVATNELITSFELIGDTNLRIIEAGDTFDVDIQSLVLTIYDGAGNLIVSGDTIPVYVDEDTVKFFKDYVFVDTIIQHEIWTASPFVVKVNGVTKVVDISDESVVINNGNGFTDYGLIINDTLSPAPGVKFAGTVLVDKLEKSDDRILMGGIDISPIVGDTQYLMNMGLQDVNTNDVVGISIQKGDLFNVLSLASHGDMQVVAPAGNATMSSAISTVWSTNITNVSSTNTTNVSSSGGVNITGNSLTASIGGSGGTTDQVLSSDGSGGVTWRDAVTLPNNVSTVFNSPGDTLDGDVVINGDSLHGLTFQDLTYFIVNTIGEFRVSGSDGTDFSIIGTGNQIAISHPPTDNFITLSPDSTTSITRPFTAFGYDRDISYTDTFTLGIRPEYYIRNFVNADTLYLIVPNSIPVGTNINLVIGKSLLSYPIPTLRLLFETRDVWPLGRDVSNDAPFNSLDIDFPRPGSTIRLNATTTSYWSVDVGGNILYLNYAELTQPNSNREETGARYYCDDCGSGTPVFYDGANWVWEYGAWTTGGRPSGGQLYSGLEGYNSTTGHYEFWNGSRWVELLDDQLLPQYANDTAADADTGLPSGGKYLITGDRTVREKP